MEVQQQEKQVENNQQQNIKDIETTAPGKLRVINRNAKVVAFEDDKIKVAITKAFLAKNAFVIATFILSSSNATTLAFLLITLNLPGAVVSISLIFCC